MHPLKDQHCCEMLPGSEKVCILKQVSCLHKALFLI